MVSGFVVQMASWTLTEYTVRMALPTGWVTWDKSKWINPWLALAIPVGARRNALPQGLFPCAPRPFPFRVQGNARRQADALHHLVQRERGQDLVGHQARNRKT